MIQDNFMRTWFSELQRIAPLAEGESHSYEDFTKSPTVRAAKFAFKMNSPSFALDLTILEENLTSCLHLKSLPEIPRNMIEQALRQVQRMKRVT